MTVDVHLFSVGHCRNRAWFVESGSFFETLHLPAMVALIRHPDAGVILFDTGYGKPLLAAASPAAGPLRVTLLATTDEHGWMEPLTKKGNDAYQGGMAYLAGRPARMDALLESALADAGDNAERARLLEVRMEAFYAQGRLADTVDLGLELFLLLNARLPQLSGPDAMADVARLLGELQKEVVAIGLDTLAAREPMRDEARLLLMSIAAKMTAAAYIVRPALLPLLTLFQVRLMVDHGHVPQALSAYAVLGLMCAEFLGDYRFAHDIGRMSMDLVKRHGWMQVFAHAGFSYHAFLSHWVDGLRVSMDGLMQTHRNGLEFGNLRHAGLGLYVHDVHAFLSGAPLAVLQEQLQTHAQRLRAMRQPFERRMRRQSFQRPFHIALIVGAKSEFAAFAHHAGKRGYAFHLDEAPCRRAFLGKQTLRAQCTDQTRP